MAFPPRPPLMQSVAMPTMVGTPFTLATTMVRAVGIPISQTISSIPTPAGARGKPPIRPPAIATSSTTSSNATSNTVNKPLSYSKRLESSGPAVTVFVGNITERAPDVMIRHILNTCGPVLSWKRVQGASGKLQAFGFCEFGNPDAALRVIRLLHDYEIADKKLVVKADAKTKELLDDYKEGCVQENKDPPEKKKKSKENGDSSPAEEEMEENDDYIDEDMKAEDREAMNRISSILSEHKKEIQNYVPPPNKQDQREKRMSRVQEKLVALSSGADIANIYAVWY